MIMFSHAFQRRDAALWAVGFVCFCCQVAAAQPRQNVQSAVKHASALRIPNGIIKVDGQLTEAGWEQAVPAADFIQQQPIEGERATHQTEVRFLYDDEYLYVGAKLFEDEPQKFITNELKRDFGARDGDLFVVAFDTFHDKLNTYNFMINPGCALRDAQSYDDGRTINANWDAVWFCKSRLVGDTLFLEVSIPFKQLRFPDTEEQTWGLQIFRLVRHSNEQTMWNPVPRNFNEFKTSYEGVLDGIRKAHPGRNLRIKPFATTQWRTSGLAAAEARKPPCANASQQFLCDGGFDTKIGLGTNLVLDGTFRTDFSNVEADAQQINLTRFSLFFPEKRDFFRENQGAFQVGPPAASSSNLVPFFSRTIGLSTDQTDEHGALPSQNRGSGNPIPIVGGVRMTGKIGRNVIGLLNMQTEGEDRAGSLCPAGVATCSLPASNFSVFRYGREFLNNSLAGGFVMDKERGAVSNRLVGADLRFYPTRAWNIDAMFMRSTKTGFIDDNAWRTGIEYDKGLNEAKANYSSLGTTFQDDLGFVPRQGVRILNLDYMRRVRPRATKAWIREFRPEMPYVRYTSIAGNVVQTATLTPTLTSEFVDASRLAVSVTRDEELLTQAFRPQGIPAGASIPAGRYRFYVGNAQYTPQNSHLVAPTLDYRFGEYYDGTRTGYTAGARVRFSRYLATILSFSRDHVKLPTTSFDTKLASLRIDASFSTRMFLNAFIQYNSITHQVLSNIRYDFIHHPLSDIFITYNDTRDSNGLLQPSKQLVLKVTHLLSF